MYLYNYALAFDGFCCTVRTVLIGIRQVLGNVMVVIEALCSQLNGPSNRLDASQDTGLLK